MKREMYKATWLDRTTKITKRQFELYTSQELVTLLNKKGFPLGSGHDSLHMLVRTNKTGVLNCTPYVGAWNQVIEFEPIKNK